VLFLFLLVCPLVGSQVPAPTTTVAEKTPDDALGRRTPRGTVFGFLKASSQNQMDIAVLYLDTPERDTDASALARQLAAVLNRYLPARLNQISDKPEGSIQDPRRPDEELIGTVTASNGDLDIVVERVNGGKAGQIWLFSKRTLAALPAFSRESNIHTVETHLPKVLVTTRVFTVPLFEWLAVFVGLPFVYFTTGLLNRLLSWIVGKLRRRIWRTANQQNPSILSVPIRLLLLALFIQWMLTIVELPLLARQIWSSISLLFTITAGIWLLLLTGGWVERYVVKHRRETGGSASVVRLLRRLVEGLVLFGGLLLTLQHFGVNVTAALAGLGVGGIVIALAAQKTLENVIAGASLIADKAVRVGDVVSVGDIDGTVMQIGLRSTRIRSTDRRLVSLPNGQMATMRLDTLSARDKFLLRQLVGLRYETTAAQLRSVVDGIHKLLSGHDAVDLTSLRVRFVRFDASAVEIEVFTYVFASDWDNFLEIQEELLHSIRDVIQKAGAGVALPSQRLYLAADNIIHPVAEESEKSDATGVSDSTLFDSSFMRPRRS
jgi:MscS family membrane protein